MDLNNKISFVNSISELKKLPINALDIEANKIRCFLIDKVASTGGHIGANLSVIELTIAIHYVFDSPADKIIFDTGHQGYTHKLLTGRKEKFDSLNTYKGMSRFIAREESEHDIIDASHAGTSISLATGISRALKNKKSEHYTVAIIGDGSLVEGMAFEALNFGSVDKNSNLVIVINDNEMAIASTVGGIRELTTGLDWSAKSRLFFENLGYKYVDVKNGHSSEDIVNALKHAKSLRQPTIVHVKTEKGKGLTCAETHPYKMHFSMPFDAVSGQGASPTVSGKTFAVVIAEKLSEIMVSDPKIHVITPATPYASSLESLFVKYPDRVIDVGMAEQHAVGMACGMALEGLKPVVCLQTTFMQRAFDQLLHDACYMDLPITILGVRAGFAGYDGSTHHGIFDIPYLKSFPRMQISYPVNSIEAQKLLEKRLENPIGPMVILHPYEPLKVPEPDSGVLNNGFSVATIGKDGSLICLGNTLEKAWELKSLLALQGKSFGIICIQNIKPFPSNDLLEYIEPSMDIITLEESVLAGGLGSLILETLSDSSFQLRVFRSGVSDTFIRPGSKHECSQEAGITAQQIVEQIQQRWADYRGD